MNYRLAAKTVLSALITTGALLSCLPVASADDPDQSGPQGQDACAGGGEGQTPEQQQQQQQACAGGIANRAVNEAKSAADQANRAANQANQNADRPPDNVLTDAKCLIWNGVPTIGYNGMTRTGTPFDSPMEGKSCWEVYGVAPTH